LTSFINNAHAASDNTWFIGVGGGKSWIGMPNNTTVSNGSTTAPPSHAIDTFTINPENAGMFQFNVGYRWHNERQLIPYYNVYFQYQHYLTTNIHGTVDQYSLPEFVNYDYRLDFQADAYNIIGKFDLIECKKWMPYLSAGFGVIGNDLRNYSETPTSGVTPRTNPGYARNVTYPFAVTLGAGIDYIITNNVWVTLGYEHLFQGGNTETGPGADSWSDTVLNIGAVKNDTLFLNLTATLPEAFRR
jgi:opacity protein-like surface antigen